MAIIEVSSNTNNVGINMRKPTEGVEYDMVSSFVEYKKNTFRENENKKLAIFIEPKINNSYPDIIFAQYFPEVYESWTKTRNLLETADLKILNYILSTQGAYSSDIVKDLSVKYKGLLSSLEKLYDCNLVYRSNGMWTPTKKDFFGITKIESVEAKISKWGEVLQQALLNRNFASESSILSKVKSEPRANLFETFNNFGIGIYLFNNSEFSKVTEPKRKKVEINHYSLLINEWIGRILNS